MDETQMFYWTGVIMRGLIQLCTITCFLCATVIIQSGIRRVVAGIPLLDGDAQKRWEESMNLFKQAGVVAHDLIGLIRSLWYRRGVLSMDKIEFKEIREKLGFSQKQLGDALGWSAQQVWNIENGKQSIQRQTELAVQYLWIRRIKIRRSPGVHALFMGRPLNGDQLTEIRSHIKALGG